jgi:hypothetical protein
MRDPAWAWWIRPEADQPTFAVSPHAFAWREPTKLIQSLYLARHFDAIS